MNTQNRCRRCGACCLEGGPALHSRDLDLIISGRISLDHLITVRKGELAHNPVTGRVQAVSTELVKIAGTGKDWRCRYYDAENKGCGIYGHRPQACETLKCWDTEAILSLVEKDVLTRLDIIGATAPMAMLIAEHEEMCPCPDLDSLANCRQPTSVQRRELEALVTADLMFREKMIGTHDLPLAREMFYFGRPIFQLLQPFGIRIAKSGKAFSLHWPTK